MKLSKSFLNRNGGAASFFFLRRRRSKTGGPSTADNPEPSSPKVTCIGQVRVKSKRRGRQHRRSLSQRRTGEASFRRAEQLQEERKNQRWVHLPASALRAFGSEFTCLLFPCCCSHCRITKSGCCYCCSNDGNECGQENGAVWGRCPVCCGGRRRETEAVSGGRDEAEAEEESESVCVWNCRRRHVFDNIEVRNGRIEVRGRSLEVEDEEGKEETGRVSICIPPKNALLLMRCRSDPTKMAALANRYCSWEHTNQGDIQEEDKDDDHGKPGNLVLEKLPESVFEGEMGGVEQEIQNELKLQLENDSEENLVVDNSGEQEDEIKAKDDEEEEEEVESNMSSFEALLDQENLDCNYQENVEEDEEEEEKKTEETSLEEDDEKQEPIGTPKDQPLVNSEQFENSKEHEEHEEEEKEEEERKQVLPDCLLLMMCEPKLSMEVSKETWVRGADFIRWLPERPRRPARAAGGACEHHQVGGRLPPAADPRTKRPVPVPAPSFRKSEVHRHQPPRSSCSLPAAAAPMAPGRAGPFSLTRCKSEPMSTAAAKLAPEPCVWGDRGGGGGVKLEPHGRAAVGGAGVGF
ncbi:Unknown protein [Striga hermonthica]|uniref:Uncharacterized protein n=1 Tax=Striga hermonthica TaxID=68872 RepID=A0A9N7R5T7_STRHE|nr:Unknown protein [Striga hermonthica]